ncbi:cytochrome P450 [Ilumatobacter sp.]|uniref:cytochrome P450 n=1 Tax=Ilumatobacter sp. TaxID=1967498 RepID=UPI003B529376
MTTTENVGSEIDPAAFNPFDGDTLQCPFPHYETMREQAPVVHIEALDMYLVTRYDLVLEVVRDIETYSSEFGGASMPIPAENRARMEEVQAEGWPRVPTMLTADRPGHTRYRRLISKAFTPKVIEELEPVIRSITTRLIDAFIDDDSIEFVEQFGVPLPVEVIAHALNVPDSRLADFKRWSDDSIAGIGTNIGLEERLEAERGVNEFQHYFAEQLELRRTEPQDDLLTNLLNARVDHDDPDIDDDRPLDMAEMLSMVQQLLVAGNETTTKLLTEMVRLLAENPEQWRELRSDPSRASLIVEEGLRLSTPTQGMFRIATKDHELDGVAIPKGARLVVVFASANRDEELFADPDAFDPDRDHLRDHLAFGKGIHFCLGAALSRLEGRVALEELSRRLDTIELTESNEFRYFPSFLLRGLTRLDVDITAADR